MFNRQRTLELLGYDIDVSRKRRTKVEIANAPQVDKKGQLRVIDNCPQCGIERNIKLKQSLKNKLCSKCFHNQDYVLAAKRSQKRHLTEETHKKMVENHWAKNGGTSPFKGQCHTEHTKSVLRQKKLEQFSNYTDDQIQQMHIKMSCSKRNISIEDFNGFVSPENTLLRQSLEGKAWTYDVLSKANFICQRCYRRGGKLHAHHKNAFNLFPDQRLSIDNGACLCESCHGKFHSQYGRGDNTAVQFNEWLHPPSSSKPTVYLLIGAPASGKSWVANQLLDKFDYISYDNNPKQNHLDLLLTPSTKSKLYDPTFKISTTIRRHSDQLDFILVAICETEEILRERMALRGGQWTNTIMNRNGEIQKRFLKYGANGFMGTAIEVLAYLRSIAATK